MQPNFQHPNVSMLCDAAKRLGPLCERVVFVGGATVPLFLTDPAAPKPRSTNDVDVIVQITTRVAYHRFGEELRTLGFMEDVDSDVLCRWKVGDLLVDVMATNKGILGFSNLWYEDTLRSAISYTLSDGVSIYLATAPHFVATKIEAFKGRGDGDFMGSRDMEDIVAIVDGREELGKEIAASDAPLRSYLAAQFSAWLNDNRFLEALSGHLSSDMASQERYPLLIERMSEIAALS